MLFLNPLRRGQRWPRIAGTAAVLLLASTWDATACDTPVYRYAMYRWLPAPYEVYYFHQDGVSEEAEQVKDGIRAASEDRHARANLVFLPVDLGADPDLAGVPPDVKQMWLQQTEPVSPSYLIASPVGVSLFTGSLSRQDLDALIDSPRRQELARLLEEGKAGVYVLVTGDDAEAAEAAEQVVSGLIADIAAGTIPLYTPPPARPGAASSEDPPAAQIGLLTVARDDEAEKWLIRCLLGTARDVTEPMLFLVYGRGRALFSCLGKGIHRDNLIQDVEFITGACSCTVKDRNPGVDLLVRYDWDAAAESLARRFDAEEGSGYQFGGDSLFPELIIPADSHAWAEAPSETESPEAAGTEDLTVATAAAPEPGAADPTAETPDPQPTADPPANGAQPDENASAPERRVAAHSAPPLVESGKELSRLSPLQGVMWVGAGLAVTLLVLFAATFLVLRRNSMRHGTAARGPDARPPMVPLGERPLGMMIQFEDVAKVYPTRQGNVRALDGVSLSVESGEFVAVRGPSGGGKSTLLALAGGLALPTSGRIVVAGEEISRAPAGRRAEFRATQVGFVFQMFHLLPFLNVIDNVLVAATRPGEPERRRRGTAAGSVRTAPASAPSAGPTQCGRKTTRGDGPRSCSTTRGSCSRTNRRGTSTPPTPISYWTR